MALSEPEPTILDPKAHLGGSSLHEMVIPGEGHGVTSHDPFADASNNSVAHAANVSAHQVNSLNNAVDQNSTSLNGFHATPSNPDDTSPSDEIKAPIPNLNTPASTQPNSLPIKDPLHEQELSSTDLPMETLSALGAPPLIQQPVSDARHATATVVEEKAILKSLPDEVQEQTTAAAAHTTPEKSLPSPAPEPVDAVGEEQHLNATAKQDEAPSLDLAKSQTPIPSQNINAESPAHLVDDSTTPVQSLPTDTTAAHEDALDATGADGTQTLSGAISDQDHVMADADQPTKVGRARDGDDDLDDERAAKRSRTDDEGLNEDFKIPDRPQLDTSVVADAPVSAAAEPSPMTKPRKKHLQKAIANIKRNQAARPFLTPVDAEALNIPNYYTIITRPMDLKTIEDKLRADGYTNISAVLADFEQILHNTKIFNGEQHPVTLNAATTKEKFEQAMASLPSADIPDSAPSKKKIVDPAVIRAPPPRRESRSSLPGSARSPTSANSPQTFALGPEGVPLIRRESNTVDGRPKREIHRPAPKDLPYTHQKPKKKKYVMELKFCDHVLKELARPMHKDIYDPFRVPVDPVALNIPSYHSVVKKPIDFGTMRTKLDRGDYENAKEFELDARQVFRNCYLFNPANDPINLLGKALERVFNDEWSQKSQWLEDHAPDSGQRSPATSDEEDSEDDEEEDEVDDNQLEIVSKLQKQIAEMSKQVEMITSGAKKKTPPTASKKVAKASKPARKDSKKAATAPVKTEKKATSKSTKKTTAPYVTYEQKQDISTRINSLSESKMTQALTIIRSNMPNLQGIQEDELELDIDELSNEVLYKLLQFVRKHAPRPDDSPLQAPISASSGAPARKKNKPMSKTEQEARIEKVQKKLASIQSNPGGISPNDVQQSIEDQSEDDEDDSESEEE